MEAITKTYYTCSKCGRVSTIKEKIEDCERSHVGIDVSRPAEMNFTKTTGPYPATLSIPMEDGATAIYHYVRRISAPVKEEPTDEDN